MPDKKIAIIGVGGRTGTMFAFELQKAADVLGVGKEIDKIQKKEFFVERNGRPLELFEVRTVAESQFPNGFSPEIIFLATKNPVGPPVKYYYQKFKENSSPLPGLVLSQNGISAAEDASAALKEVLGKEAEKVQVIRVSLFNPVEKRLLDNKICISYFLPIRLSFGVISGNRETKEIKELFEKAEIEATEFLPGEVKNMEFSKFFTNLIGIPSATRGLSIKEGFKDSEIFKEEIEALREYVKAVRAAKGGFLNLSKVPVKLLAELIYCLPLPILLFFRKQLGKLIDKGRGGKPKGNLDEIDYYNGEVVKLGKELGVSTPINEKIIKKVREILKL